MTLFATDLDNTLIFSKGFVKNEDVIAVEYKDNQELSYITKQAFDILEKLSKEITVVPITSRSLEEFKQITFYNLFEHAILSNGLVILYKGLVEDGNWQSIIQKEFDKMDLADVESLLYNCSSLFKSDFELKGYYYYAEVKEHQEIMVLKLLKPFLHKDWNCFVQDNKLYVTPKIVTKENALKFLSKKYDLDLLHSWGVGDSKIDKGFIDLTMNKISFVNSELWDSLREKEKYKYSIFLLGLSGSEEMLKMIGRFL